MLLSPFRSLIPLPRGISERFLSRSLSRSFSSLPSSVKSGGATTPAAEHHDSEPKGLYNMPQDHAHHGDPRKFLNPDGTYTYPATPHAFHFEDTYTNVPKQHIVSVNGKKMIKGIEPRPLVELFSIHQVQFYAILPKKANERLRQPRPFDEGGIPFFLDPDFHHLVTHE
ncbi:uncharacterized protein LOC34619073 [Cyclospora cayetanensis]|uniref:Uncharacterized protein LOC34619073 n=1 Tax=Cyclospora cayetanensis TaxID=88456 RepID=A0A6P6RZR9_9EIME|nr:uncharacterized protein LOC34619073 [Cyclospora cayetanensis]